MRSGEVDLPSESRTGGFYLGIAVWAVNTPIALALVIVFTAGHSYIRYQATDRPCL